MLNEIIRYLRAEIDLVERGGYETPVWFSAEEAGAYESGRAKGLTDVLSVVERWQRNEEVLQTVDPDFADSFERNTR